MKRRAGRVKKWVFIFEDQQIGVSYEAPTKTDLECVQDGTMVILEVVGNVSEVSKDDGDYCKSNIQECRITDEYGDPFHTL